MSRRGDRAVTRAPSLDDLVRRGRVNAILARYGIAEPRTKTRPGPLPDGVPIRRTLGHVERVY